MAERYPDQTRNLNPHADAILAMCMYGGEYAAQRGGCMDFWDGLSQERKRFCRGVVEKILAARHRDRAEIKPR